MSNDLYYFWMLGINKDAIHNMPADLLKKVMDMAYEYFETGEIPELSGEEYYAFYLIKVGIDMAKEQHRKNKENGKKGAAVKAAKKIELAETSQETSEVEEEPKIKRKTNKRLPATCEEIVNLYNEMCPSLKGTRSINESRKKKITKLLERHSLDEIKEAFHKAENSEFLRNGAKDSTWNGADFDFVINENKFVRILEGVYDDKTDHSGLANDISRYDDSDLLDMVD